MNTGKNTPHDTHTNLDEVEKENRNGNNENITITTKSTTAVAATTSTTTVATTTEAAAVATLSSYVLYEVYRTRTGTPDAKNKCNKKFIGKRCTLTVSHIISFIFSLAWFHAIHTRLFTASSFFFSSNRSFFVPYDQLGKHIWFDRAPREKKITRIYTRGNNADPNRTPFGKQNML